MTRTQLTSEPDAYTGAMRQCRKHHVDRSGRIAVPRDVLAAAGIEPGSRVGFEIVPGGLLIHAIDGSPLAQEQGLVVYKGTNSDPAVEAVRETREARTAVIAGTRRRK